MNRATQKSCVRWVLFGFLVMSGMRAAAQVDCLGVEGGSALPDTPCDDGLVTQNDTWSNSCECIGICFSDSGPSGPPGSMCDDGNPNTIGDVWDDACSCGGPGGWVDCEGTLGGFALPGIACDDGDGSTLNDVWSANCVCVGDGPTMAHQLAGPGRGVHLWPNPVREVLNISMTNRYPGIVRISIIDPQGRTVLSEPRSVVNGFADLPIRQLPDGLYTIRLESGREVMSQRFVKTR